MRKDSTHKTAFLAIAAVYLVASFGITGCQKKVAVNAEGGEEQEAAEPESGNSIGSWASDTWNGAINGGAQTVEGTGQWITDTYKSAKDQGITKASSVKEWVADDWNAQGDWQYKIMSIQSGNPEQIEKTLNKAGADRWECYHVDTSSETWTFFMKRSRRSYLSRVPLKDLANMLPGASGESGE